jgi:hypothetical protein
LTAAASAGDLLTLFLFVYIAALLDGQPHTAAGAARSRAPPKLRGVARRASGSTGGLLLAWRRRHSFAIQPLNKAAARLNQRQVRCCFHDAAQELLGPLVTQRALRRPTHPTGVSHATETFKSSQP